MMHRRGGIAALTAALGLFGAACGNSGSGSAGASGSTSTIPTTETTLPSPPTTLPGLALTDYGIELKAPDGTDITGTFSLSHVVPASQTAEIEATWSRFASNQPPCQVDLSRDAEVVGEVQFINHSPAFMPDLDIIMSNDGGPTEVGISQCTDLSQPDSGIFSPVIVPAWIGQTTTKQIPIQFVIRGYYSPAHPDGDPTVLAAASPGIAAYVGSPAQQKGQYTITAGQGVFDQNIYGQDTGPPSGSVTASLRLNRLR